MWSGYFYEIIENLLVNLAIASFSISCFSISILSRFYVAILFRFFSSFSFSISKFSSCFILSIFVLLVSLFFYYLSLIWHVYMCWRKKRKFFIIICLSCDLRFAIDLSIIHYSGNIAFGFFQQEQIFFLSIEIVIVAIENCSIKQALSKKCQVTCLTCQCAFAFYMSSFFQWLTWLHLLRTLRTFIFLSALPAFIFLRTLRALRALIFLRVLRAFIFLRASHAFIFYVPYVPSFFYVLTFYLSMY